MTSYLSHWTAFLDVSEEEFGKETLNRWARSLHKIDETSTSLTLCAKDPFQSLWIKEHLQKKFEAYLVEKSIKIRLNILHEGQKNQKGPQAQAKNQEAKKTSSFQLYLPELDFHATYDRFIPSEENNLTLKALDEILSTIIREKLKSLSSLHTPLPSNSSFLPNPVFIYGSSGSGKTHLLQAMAHKLKQAGLKVLYAPAEIFTEHVIKSMRAGEMAFFRKLWRNLDALFIDDVHVLSKKSATQEEFFHTFNSLHVLGKPIFISSVCMPQQLQFIEPRLVSRFEWGIVLELFPLCKKAYRNLLEQKAKTLHFTLSNKILDFILSTFTSTPKACVQALEALILRTSMSSHSTKKTHEMQSTEQFRALLKDIIEEEEKTALSCEKIIALTTQAYGTTVDDIIGKSQSREFALPRQVSMYLMRKHLKMPYMKIGDKFSRDHSTVMSAIRHIEKLIKDPSSDVGSSISSIEIRMQN